MSVETSIKESMHDAVFSIVATSIAYRLTGDSVEARWFIRILAAGICVRTWSPFLGAIANGIGAALALALVSCRGKRG